MPKIEINLKSHGRGTVKIDGHEIPGVTKIITRAAFAERNMVRLTISPKELSINMEESDISKEGIKPCQE